MSKLRGLSDFEVRVCQKCLADEGEIPLEDGACNHVFVRRTGVAGTVVTTTFNMRSTKRLASYLGQAAWDWDHYAETRFLTDEETRSLVAGEAHIEIRVVANSSAPRNPSSGRKPRKAKH